MRRLITVLTLTLFAIVDGVQAVQAATLAQTLSVSIQGESYVKAGSQCTYTSTVTGGSGSYTYEWNLGGSNVVGTNSSVNITVPSGTHVGLVLYVWDGATEAQDGIMLVIADDGSQCNS